jgi:hypothetical protein
MFVPFTTEINCCKRKTASRSTIHSSVKFLKKFTRSSFIDTVPRFPFSLQLTVFNQTDTSSLAYDSWNGLYHTKCTKEDNEQRRGPPTYCGDKTRGKTSFEGEVKLSRNLHEWMNMNADGAKGDPCTATISDILCVPTFSIPPVVSYLLRSTVTYIKESYHGRMVPWNLYLSDKILIQLSPHTHKGCVRLFLLPYGTSQKQHCQLYAVLRGGAL